MSEFPVVRQRPPVVHIIDDEPNLRASLLNLFDSMDISAEAFESAEAFLSDVDGGTSGCILLDVQMPGMSGLDLQRELMRLGNPMPIIFMTGNASVSMSISAMKAGAFDFLLKPFNSAAVTTATTAAIERDEDNRKRARERNELRACKERLTPREAEVLEYVSKGLMNKQIAFEMSISEIMVKLHRGRMMRKMQAKTIVDVVRKYDLLLA